MVVQIELGEPEVEDDVDDVRVAVVDAAFVVVVARRHHLRAVAKVELNFDEPVDD